MVAYPEVQKRAQAELDTVVGRGRVPTFADRALLPFTVAILREVLRWRTGIPLGLPHTADEEGWYEGMFIPKGSMLIANMLPCNRDPAVYGDDGDQFKPERHLDEEGRLKPAPPATKDHGHVSFGFGRRVCVGQHVAEDTLFIATAVLLWAFDSPRHAMSKGGRSTWMQSVTTMHTLPCKCSVQCITPPAHVATRKAKPYECSIRPRFSEVHAVIAGEKELQAA